MGEMNHLKHLAKQMTYAQSYGMSVGKMATLTATWDPTLKWYLDNGAKLVVDVECVREGAYSLDLPAVPTMEWELNE